MSLWPISVLLSADFTHSNSFYSCHPHILLFSHPAPYHSLPSDRQHRSLFHFICAVHYAAVLFFFFFTPPLVCFLFKLLCPLPICFYSCVCDSLSSFLATLFSMFLFIHALLFTCKLNVFLLKHRKDFNMLFLAGILYLSPPLTFVLLCTLHYSGAEAYVKIHIEI